MYEGEIHNNAIKENNDTNLNWEAAKNLSIN